MTRGPLRWSRAVAFGLSGAVLLPLLAACSDPTESYCGELEEQQPVLRDLAERADDPGTDVFGESLGVFGTLREAAPGDVADEWDTLYFAWEGLSDAFDAAGASPRAYDPANPPEGIDQAEQDAIADAAAELRSQRVTDAGDGIEQHARDVCGVDLGL